MKGIGGIRLFAGLLGLVASARAAPAAVAAPPVARAAHWVIRTSDLKVTLDFFTGVFGLKVLRHEENDKPCPITCNGDSPTAWSKTMLGYDTEDKGYAIEVTYNYGVASYNVGTGLASFAVAVADVATAKAAAAAQGFATRLDPRGGCMVVGPDGYRVLAVAAAASSPRAEAFLGVRLHVRDSAAAAAWYVEALRMQVLPRPRTGSAADGDGPDVFLGYAPDQVALSLRGTGQAPKLELWEGRNAISMPARLLQDVYARILAETPELVVHGIMELEESLGTLFIAIVKDLDGFEVCLVSSETFDQAVLAAADFVGPDYALRATLEAARAAAAAQAAARAAHSKQVGVLGGGAASTYVRGAALPDGGGFSGGGAGWVATLEAVLRHVLAALKANTMSKTEGNFLAVGGTLGFTVAAFGRAFLTSKR